MKHIIPILALCLAVSCAKPHDGSFVLHGTVENATDSEQVCLSYPVLMDGIWYQKTDTTEIVDGKFRFDGKVGQTTSAYLTINDMYDMNIYIEPAEIGIKFDMEQPYVYVLSGTTVDKELSELQKKIREYEVAFYELYKRVDEISEQQAAEGTPEAESLQEEMISISSEFKAIGMAKSEAIYEFAAEHKDYAITPNLIFTLLRQESAYAKQAKELYASLSEKSKNSVMGQLAGIQLEISNGSKGCEVGDTAPDFTGTGASGEVVSLSDYRGRSHVLLDFWASWCGPCLRSLPTVRELQAKYAGHGMEVIGISSDDDRSSWLGAIEANGLTAYPQILSFESDNEKGKLFFWRQEHISLVYEVEYIPCYILIDKEGKIVGRWQQRLRSSRILKSLCAAKSK